MQHNFRRISTVDEPVVGAACEGQAQPFDTSAKPALCFAIPVAIHVLQIHPCIKARGHRQPLVPQLSNELAAYVGVAPRAKCPVAKASTLVVNESIALKPVQVAWQHVT
jgi:hypothetical protein